MFAMKPPRLLTRPRQRAGKISFKMQSLIQTAQICGVIQGLNGTPDANSLNEAMSHDYWTITNIKSKANIFIHHYAGVSKLYMSRADRDLNRQFKKHLNAPSADDESCASFQMGELLSSIKKMKCKGAAGPENIPPSFLRSLGPLAPQEFLSILSSSLAHCPHLSTPSV